MSNPKYSNGLMLTIDNSIKSIMKDGKIDKNDIPQIILLLTTVLANEQQLIGSIDIVQILNELYDYIMTHYKLYPDDPVQREEFKTLFDTCIKLVAFKVPEINKDCCKNFFGCK